MAAIEQINYKDFTTFPKRLMATGPHAFEAVTAQLSAEQKACLLQKIESINKVQVEASARQIQAGNYKLVEGIGQWEDAKAPFEDTMFKTLYAGKISLTQFCTALFIHGYLVGEATAEKILPIPLFTKSGAMNPEAQRLIRETATPLVTLTPEKQERYFFKDKSKFCKITEERLDQFFELMRKAPPSEQQLFIIPNTHPKDHHDTPIIPEKSDANKKSMLFATEYSIAFGVYNVGFCALDRIHDRSLRMIASYWMLQAYVHTLSPNPAKGFQLEPLVGSITVKQIAESVGKQKRIFALPAPRNFPSPETADGFRAAPFPEHVKQGLRPKKEGNPSRYEKVFSYSSFSWHDFFHLCEITILPEKLISAHCLLMNLLEPHLSDPYISIIYQILGDFDFAVTYFSSDKSLSENFWYFLAETFLIMPIVLPQLDLTLYNQAAFIEESLLWKKGIMEIMPLSEPSAVNIYSQFIQRIPLIGKLFLENEQKFQSLDIFRGDIKKNLALHQRYSGEAQAVLPLQLLMDYFTFGDVSSEPTLAKILKRKETSKLNEIESFAYPDD